MVERIEIKKRYFLYIGIMTCAIFLFGIWIGYNLDQMKSGFLERETTNAILESDSFGLSQIYLQNHPDYCKLMSTRINQIAEIVEQLGSDLDKFSDRNAFMNYTALDRRYFLYEIRFWLSVEDYKKQCQKNITTILFFYKKYEPKSYEQGLVLTGIKDVHKENVMIFSIDRDSKEPLIDIMKEDFNITTTPTLIVNKKKYEGFLSRDELEKIIV